MGILAKAGIGEEHLESHGFGELDGRLAFLFVATGFHHPTHSPMPSPHTHLSPLLNKLVRGFTCLLHRFTMLQHNCHQGAKHFGYTI